MIITAMRVEGDAATVTIEVTATIDVGSHGIRRVQVFDGARDPLDAREGDCEPFFHFFVPNVFRARLPVFVVVTECPPPGSDASGPRTVVGPLLNEERGDLAPTLRCLPATVSMPNVNNARCVESQADVQRTRNKIRHLCSDVASSRRQRDEASVVAVAAITAAIAAFVAAGAAASIPFFGQAVAVGLIIAGILLAAIGIGATVAAAFFSVQLGDRLGDVRRAQEEYDDRIARVQRVCCPEFIDVPLDAPGCE